MSRRRKIEREEYRDIVKAFNQLYSPRPTKRAVYEEIAEVFDVHWKVIERIVIRQSQLDNNPNQMIE